MPTDEVAIRILVACECGRFSEEPGPWVCACGKAHPKDEAITIPVVEDLDYPLADE